MKGGTKCSTRALAVPQSAEASDAHGARPAYEMCAPRHPRPETSSMGVGAAPCQPGSQLTYQALMATSYSF